MTAYNEVIKLVAKALEIIKSPEQFPMLSDVEDAIKLLEEAVDKLATEPT